MKTLFKITSLVITSIFLFGFAPPSTGNFGQANINNGFGMPSYKLLLPDLIVQSFEITGRPVRNVQNVYEVPARVVVKNMGAKAIQYSYVSVFYKQLSGGYSTKWNLAGFRRTDRGSSAYPYTPPLASDATETMTGIIYLHPSTRNSYLYLNARADSCAGIEFMPNYCYVFESNEKNNFSSSTLLLVR